MTAWICKCGNDIMAYPEVDMAKEPCLLCNRVGCWFKEDEVEEME